MTDEEDNNGMSKDPTLTELFDFFDDDDGGMRIVPISFKNTPEDARQLIVVMGNPEMVHQVMAKFMSEVEELHELIQQKEASGESVIETVDGKKLNGTSKIVKP